MFCTSSSLGFLSTLPSANVPHCYFALFCTEGLGDGVFQGLYRMCSGHWWKVSRAWILHSQKSRAKFRLSFLAIQIAEANMCMRLLSPRAHMVLTVSCCPVCTVFPWQPCLLTHLHSLSHTAQKGMHCWPAIGREHYARGLKAVTQSAGWNLVQRGGLLTVSTGIRRA